jgi:hypothetical protein
LRFHWNFSFGQNAKKTVLDFFKELLTQGLRNIKSESQGYNPGNDEMRKEIKACHLVQQAMLIGHM